MEQETVTSDVAATAEPAISNESVADAFSGLMSSQSDQPDNQQQIDADDETPETMTQATAAERQQQTADAEADDLPDFTLDDTPATIEKLYSQEELQQLAETNPDAAWAYAAQANDYLQQNLQTIQEIQAAAEKVGSVEALTTLGDLGAALFTPGEQTPATVYQTLMRLQEAYPDAENGPMNQIARAMVNYRAPEMIAEMGDQLTTFLAGTHPYLDLTVYGAEDPSVRHQAQQYIGHLQQQRAQLLEALAPVVYKHFGNDFGLKEQYRLVGPEGEFYGLADNTIDKGIRADLPEELRAVYDAMPPGIRGKLNNATRDEILDNLSQRKIASDAQAKLEQIEKQNAENERKINERFEAQQKEQADSRAKSWEEGVTQHISQRLTGHYKLGQYPATIIQMQLKQFMQTDPAAKQVYDRALEAAKAGNAPLLKRIEGDLSRHAEKAIRQYMAEWQKATGQRVQKPTLPTAQPGRKVVPLYNGPQAPQGNGRDHDGVGSVADEFSQAFKNLSPYVNQ